MIRPENSIPSLESILCTEVLDQRPSRPPDHEKQSHTLASLSQALADSPRTFLHALAEAVADVLPADSAGISLLTTDGERFHWPAIAGQWKPHIGGGTPRDFGPSGDVLDRNSPLLFRRFERRYAYFLPLTPPAEECLMVPFSVEGKVVGTIWAIAHDERRRFDREDLRLLVNLGTFAASAYQTVRHLQELSAQLQERKQVAQTMREMNEMLLVSSVRQHELTEHALKAEAALRDSEQRRRFVMESMPQKVFSAKPNGEVDYFNPQWTAFTGLALEDILGWGWTKFIHPDDVDENVRVWQHSIDTGEPFIFEHRFRRADGEYRWHFSRAIAMRDATGKVTLWIGSSTDVHDIKRVETELRASEVRYRGLFEASKDGVLILDFTSGKILDANPFMTELLGYSYDELSGKELWEIGVSGDKSTSESAVRELQLNGYLRYENLPLLTKSGRRIHVEVIATAYREALHGVIQCTLRDITERSRLEALLAKHTEELSALHRRKDEFLAMLSHELRSPLAPIAGAVQLLGLQRESESPIQLHARNILERQVGHLRYLIDDLLDISRITRGGVQIRRTRVAVSDLLKHAVETVQPMMDERQHELTLSIPPEPIWLDVDAVRMQQVVANLLGNAAKYTEEGGHIWLTVVRTGGECAFHVRDTGVGISPELLPSVFDLFTQAERSLDRSQGGLGIGLALVKQITELHGGSVEAHSVLGQGSEFIVRLTLALSEGSDTLSPAPKAVPQIIQTLRVLVVDDNLDSAEALGIILSSSGHEVRTAHDGPTALAAALVFRPNVVVLDIGMPKMDGFEVATKVRLIPGLEGVVLVALTGYGSESARQSSRNAGIDHHLVKPVEFPKLRTILAGVSRNLT